MKLEINVEDYLSEEQIREMCQESLKKMVKKQNI